MPVQGRGRRRPEPARPDDSRRRSDGITRRGSSPSTNCPISSGRGSASAGPATARRSSSSSRPWRSGPGRSTSRPPGLVRKPVEIFLDIEGIPDEQFHYLIGSWCRGETRTFPFVLGRHEGGRAAGLGEPAIPAGRRPRGAHRPLRELRVEGHRPDRPTVRHGCRDVPWRMVNLNEEVFGRVYFPVRSNGLKDIGASWRDLDRAGGVRTPEPRLAASLGGGR